MTIRALVARMDGVPDRSGMGFAHGSIKPTEAVPVTRDFDATALIGTAAITITGDDVFADIDTNENLVGKYPALGFRVLSMEPGLVTNAELITVGICTTENADPHIPPIA